MAGPLYPDVPDAPGVPPVRRSTLSILSGFGQIGSTATGVLDLGAAVSVFSPDLGGQVLTGASTILQYSSAGQQALRIADQIAAISNIQDATTALSSVGGLVSTIDPQLGRQISAAASVIRVVSDLVKTKAKQAQVEQTPAVKIPEAISFEWGIYLDGALALEPDSIVGVGYAGEYRLSDYPLEAGDLETYNKVRMPFELRVQMTKGGTLAERQGFLKSVEKMRGDRKLYDVVTPEATYENVNVERVSLNRSVDAGATLLTVELGLREVRQTLNIAASNSREAASAPAVNNGSVQTRSSTTNARSIV